MLQRCPLIAIGFALVIGCSIAAKLTSAEPIEIRPTRVIHCEDVDDRRPTVVTGVAITRDGRTIAAATDDHRVLIWDATTGELKSHLDGHDDWIHSVVLSPDGNMLASGGGDRMLCLWNVAEHKRLLQ